MFSDCRRKRGVEVVIRVERVEWRRVMGRSVVGGVRDGRD